MSASSPESVDVHVIPRSPTVSAYAWYVLVVLTLTNIVGAVDRFMMGILVVPLKGAMHLTDTELGLLQGMGFALLYSLAGLPCGRLADRIDRRLMIAVGCLAWTVATAACAFANSFATLFVARVFVGLGEATLLPAAMSLLGAYFPRERIGLSTGVFVVGSSLGKAIAFIGGGALLGLLAAAGGIAVMGRHFEPWQALFLAAALPGILTTVLCFTMREPARAPGEGGRSSSLRDLWEHVWGRRAAFGLFVVAATCVVTVGILFAAWAPSFFVRQFGLGISNAAMLVGVTALIVSPIGAVVGGQITDALARRGLRTGPLTVLTLALCVIAPASYVAFVFSDNLALSVAAYGLAQATVLASGPQCYAGLQSMTPMRHRGTVSATFLALTTLTSLGFGVPVIGMLSDYAFNGGDNSLGLSLFTAIGSLSVLGVWIGVIARRPVAKAGFA
ncbi:MAG TPA: MFS transporter [Caulobacteraceae bacterium]|nr:MFS transporter [Caulobacteraceae bacterium]